MADNHIQEMLKHCRVCGKRVTRFKAKFQCEKHCSDLQDTYGIAVVDDEASIHPPFFCHSCYNVVDRAKKARKANKIYQPSVQLFTAWAAHSEDGCLVCDHFDNTAGGGRPTKIKTGRPPLVSVRSAKTHLITVAPPSFGDKLDKNCFSSGSCVDMTDLLCRLCNEVLDRPIHLNLQQYGLFELSRMTLVIFPVLAALVTISRTSQPWLHHLQ